MRVVDSRPARNLCKRRRACFGCGLRVSTVEVPIVALRGLEHVLEGLPLMVGDDWDAKRGLKPLQKAQETTSADGLDRRSRVEEKRRMDGLKEVWEE